MDPMASGDTSGGWMPCEPRYVTASIQRIWPKDSTKDWDGPRKLGSKVRISGL